MYSCHRMSPCTLCTWRGVLSCLCSQGSVWYQWFDRVTWDQGTDYQGESDDIKQMTLTLSNDTTQSKWSYLPPNTPRITWWGKCVAMNTLEMQTLIWINQKRLQRNDQVSLRWKNTYKRKKQRNCITGKIKGVTPDDLSQRNPSNWDITLWF